MKIQCQKNFIAGIVCMMILFTILSATAFGISHSNHPCSRSHCIVCEHIKILLNATREIGESVSVLLIAFMMLAYLKKMLLKSFDSIVVIPSPITLKVRMNN